MKASVVSFLSNYGELQNEILNEISNLLSPCISCRTKMSDGTNETKKSKVSGTVLFVCTYFFEHQTEAIE